MFSFSKDKSYWSISKSIQSCFSLHCFDIISCQIVVCNVFKDFQKQLFVNRFFDKLNELLHHAYLSKCCKITFGSIHWSQNWNWNGHSMATSKSSISERTATGLLFIKTTFDHSFLSDFISALAFLFRSVTEMHWSVIIIESSN